MPAPSSRGTVYRVQKGETLWRIAHDFGFTSEALARANRMSVKTPLRVGQKLFIPITPDTGRFAWPARGTISRIRKSTSGRSLEIQASEGSIVRASRTGRVAVAAQELAGFGRTILVEHPDGYVTVYAGLEQLLVVPGTSIAQGSPIGRLGRLPLYFEIRYGARATDPLKLLP